VKPYRVAIIGTGKAVNSHFDAIRQARERVELVAAVDLDETCVRTACEQQNISNWYTDTATMLAEMQPDLVHIVTPPATHYPLSLQCLEAGAWVFCEKPLCGSLAEFDRLAEAEAQTGCYISTVFQWRFGSAARHLKQLMATGELGRPLLAHCQTLWYRDMDYYSLPYRGKWAGEFGGPTVILGIHLMDLLLWLMGDWEEVRAMVATLDRPLEVEDVSLAHVRFANGALGSISNSALSPRQESTLRLDFQSATVEVTALYRYTNANWRYSLPPGSAGEAGLTRWQSIETDISGTHAVQLQELLDSMDRGERPFVSGREARRILEFITCLYKSAFTGQPIRRGSITPDDPYYHALSGKVRSIL
jgi:predicted dehydrogenase